jgi:hypothetical protein
MIEKEVLNILEKRSPSIQASMIGKLTDEFRSGRNPSELSKLLDSANNEVSWIGIYIIGEINIKNHKVLQFIIEKLLLLTEHEDSKIRYGVLICLSSLLKETDPKEANKLYSKMSEDSDEGVRNTAKQLHQTGKMN